MLSDDLIDNDANRSKVDCCILKTVTAINQKLACNSAIAFGSAEINRPGGYVISEPGLYCLKEDVIFAPRASTVAPPNPAAVQAAITIQASNVFLDLGAHTLSQAGEGTSEQVPYVVGILIPDMIPASTDTSALAPGGLQSIHIKGDDPAVIQGFSMFGISAFAHIFDLRLTNITVKNCGGLASKALRPFPNYFPHTVLAVPGYGPSFGVGGISIGESTVLGLGPNFFVDVDPLTPLNRVGSVVLENVSCLNCFAAGLRLNQADNVTINDCHFDDTYSDEPGQAPWPGTGFPSIGAIGGAFTNADSNLLAYSNQFPVITNMVVSNTTFNRTRVTGTTRFVDPIIGGFSFTAIGASAGSSDNVVWNNCQFNDSLCEFVGNGVVSMGYIQGSATNSTFNYCSFNGTRSFGSPQGFHNSGAIIVPSSPAVFPQSITIVSSQNLTLNNCTASDIQQIGNQQLPFPVTQTTGAVGYNLSFAKGVVMNDCNSSGIISNGPLTAGAANTALTLATTGLASAFEENIVIKGFTASRVLSLQGGLSRGITVRASRTSAGQVIRNCSFENCNVLGCISQAPNIAIAPTVTFTGTIAGSILTVSAASGTLVVGQTITGAGVSAGTTIVAVIVPGVSYQVSISQNVAAPTAMTATSAAAAQSVGIGYYIEQETPNNPPTTNSFPVSFTSCKAMGNKGLPTLFIAGTPNVALYSAGYSVLNAQRYSFFDCEAFDNVYGFLFEIADRCAIRECRSDNNLVIGVIPTGAGSVTIANAGTGYAVNDILTIRSPNTPGTNNEAKIQVTSIGAGGVITGITVLSSGFGFTTAGSPYATTTTGAGTGATINVTSVTTVGEGFTDVGPIPGTPLAPGVSTSTFERNNALKNGAGTIHDGTNGNYNIIYNAVGPVREALLTGSLSVANSYATTASQPEYFAISHNLSVIQ